MISCGHCKGLHPTVADVRKCSEGEMRVPRALRSFTEEDEREMQRMEAEADRRESERDMERKAAKWDAEARSFGTQMRNTDGRSLRELLHEVDELLCTKQIPEQDHRWSRAIRALISGQNGTVTEYALRTAIARLEAYPNVRAGGRSTGYPEPARSIERANVEGLYRKDGRLYQVVRNQKGTHLYAKLVTFPPADSQAKRPALTYAPGIMARLTVDDLVPAEEANDLTKGTGWCVFGHFLTNPVSIKRGMGPKCWERYGKPAAAKAVA